MVGEAVVRTVAPLRERARELRADERALRAVLRAGAARARARADLVWERVAAVTGLAAGGRGADLNRDSRVAA